MVNNWQYLSPIRRPVSRDKQAYGHCAALNAHIGGTAAGRHAGPFIFIGGRFFVGWHGICGQGYGKNGNRTCPCQACSMPPNPIQTRCPCPRIAGFLQATPLPACLLSPCLAKSWPPIRTNCSPLAFPINRSASRAKSSARQRLPKPKAAGSSFCRPFCSQSADPAFQNCLVPQFLARCKTGYVLPVNRAAPDQGKTQFPVKARADAPIIHQ